MSNNSILPFEGIDNFRDLGGIEINRGCRIAGHLLYRSATLSNTTDQDLRTLSQLGIKTVVDLRSYMPFENKPDRLPQNHPIRLVRLPIINRPIVDLIPKLQALRDNSDGGQDLNGPMIDIYRSFPIDFRAELATFIDLISKPDNLPLICHCSAGKDRTGFFIAVILTLLGADLQVVIEDYLQSNCVRERIENDFVNKYELPLELARSAAEARTAFLEASFQSIDQKYGSFQRYLQKGLHFSPAARQALESVLLNC